MTNVLNDLAHNLLSHSNTGNLDEDLEVAFMALMRVADERAQQEEDAATDGDGGMTSASRRPIIRVLVEDYGAHHICKWAREEDGESEED